MSMLSAAVVCATRVLARSQPRQRPCMRKQLAAHFRFATPVSPVRRCAVQSPAACAQSHSINPHGHGGRSASVTLQLPSAATVTLFGVQHAEADAEVGEAILRRRPAAVVVETALTVGHGAETGAVFQTDDQGAAQELQRDLRARIICQFGQRLRDAASPVDDPIWQTARQQFGAEQLAYIAAIAVDAVLIHGDVPKDITFRRLIAVPTLRELDEAYALQSWLNYRELLTGRSAAADWTNGDSLGAIDSIMLLERDAALASSVRTAAIHTGPGDDVIAVMGEAHLRGVEQLLREPQMLALHDNHVPLDVGLEEVASAADYGVRLALLESLLRLSCRPEVVEALQASLPSLSGDQQYDYEAVLELYGTTRMMMAVLGKQQLAQVISGLDCDFYDVLGPIDHRAA